jgi:predicted dehydrogenase
MQRPWNRRRFLATSALASPLFAAPLVIPSSAFGANERITTGHIGVGGRGKGNLSSFLKNAIAVCDVDSNRLAAAKKMVEAKNPQCHAFTDYRQLLERNDIDAVVITTPDHWHALMTIHACQAGKDVYVEKPLSLTILEGRKMVAAARAANRVVQTGSQQRSDDKFRVACELVRSGHIGQVHTVLVGIPTPNHAGAPVADSEPPPELNYDLWLGPAPLRPYNSKRVHYNFRFFRDYSGGQMTNFGAHHLDIAQWGLGMDDSGPVSSEGTGTFHEQSWHEVSETCRITYTYANGVKVILGQKQADIPQGATFQGDKGTIYVTRGTLKVNDKTIQDPLKLETSVKLTVSKSHTQNFLDCVVSRERPICDVEIGHRSATVCHLGNLTLYLGRKLNWNPQTEQFEGDEEANRHLLRPYREPWKLA